MELFSRLQVLEKASRQEGLISCEVQVPADDDDDHLLVTALWRSAGAYRGWLENPMREDLNRELGPLTASDPEPRVYDVVETLPTL